MNKIEISPCPFCKEKPDDVFTVKEPYPYVWCTNKVCPIYEIKIHYQQWTRSYPLELSDTQQHMPPALNDDKDTPFGIEIPRTEKL